MSREEGQHETNEQKLPLVLQGYLIKGQGTGAGQEHRQGASQQRGCVRSTSRAAREVPGNSKVLRNRFPLGETALQFLQST